MDPLLPHQERLHQPVVSMCASMTIVSSRASTAMTTPNTSTPLMKVICPLGSTDFLVRKDEASSLFESPDNRSELPTSHRGRNMGSEIPEE